MDHGSDCKNHEKRVATYDGGDRDEKQNRGDDLHTPEHPWNPRRYPQFCEMVNGAR